MRSRAGGVGRSTSVVATMLEIQTFDDEGARVLVVAPDGHGVRDRAVQIE